MLSMLGLPRSAGAVSCKLGGILLPGTTLFAWFQSFLLLFSRFRKLSNVKNWIRTAKLYPVQHSIQWWSISFSKPFKNPDHHSKKVHRHKFANPQFMSHGPLQTYPRQVLHLSKGEEGEDRKESNTKRHGHLWSFVHGDWPYSIQNFQRITTVAWLHPWHCSDSIKWLKWCHVWVFCWWTKASLILLRWKCPGSRSRNKGFQQGRGGVLHPGRGNFVPYQVLGFATFQRVPDQLSNVNFPGVFVPAMAHNGTWHNLGERIQDTGGYRDSCIRRRIINHTGDLCPCTCLLTIMHGKSHSHPTYQDVTKKGEKVITTCLQVRSLLAE